MSEQTIFQFDDNADDFDSRLICKNCGAELLGLHGAGDLDCQECYHQGGVVDDEISYLPTAKDQDLKGQPW